jgi:hypothetical protein
VPWEESADGGCADDDAVVSRGAFFGEGGGSVSDVSGGVGS